MVKSEDSRPASLKTLPPYLGEYEAKSEIRALPSQRRTGPKKIDAKALTDILSTPVKCTITLAELLKIKPELWTEVGKCLEKFGVKNPIKVLQVELETGAQHKKRVEPVPINKVGDYCEGEEGNTTLPVECNGVQTKAILESGARIAILTKQMWEK